MKVKEFFFGTEEEKKAAETVKLLSAQKRLRLREERQFDAARKIVRKRYLRLVGGFTGLSLAGGSAYIMKHQSDEKPIDQHESASEPTVDPETQDILIDSAAVRKIYNEGFELLMRDIPDQPNQNDPFEIQLLSGMKNFRKRYVRWATLQGDLFIALEDGIKNGGWLVAMPPQSPHTKKQNNILEIDTNPESNTLKIKPVRIAPAWAGIGLVHELIHLFDRVSGVEPKKSSRTEYLSGESRAYQAEVAAMNRFTQERFLQAVREFIEKHKPSLAALSAHDCKSPGLCDAMIRELDPVVTTTRPQSHHEGGMRLTVFHIALGFEMIRSTVPNPGEQAKARLTFIEQLMSSGPKPSAVPFE